MGLFNFLFGGISSSIDVSATTHADITSSSDPSVNIDGTPMVGSVDINGNPYGVTSMDDSLHSTCLIDNSYSSFDNTSSFDSFDSSCSGFDDW
ncbi:hypothetical protein QWY77_01680 [Thalassotalea ponticola]|uniref:hypothetical protein n=1 Tax=Thalassotalea ponticola TaxID=1523392 RepID=UPI0025B367E3|nr:hypothetical protein [Thalassotalea ponticola]MDN3651494.1 hypothetical protein [Thalassotalea ponticola]